MLNFQYLLKKTSNPINFNNIYVLKTTLTLLHNTIHLALQSQDICNHKTVADFCKIKFNEALFCDSQ